MGSSLAGATQPLWINIRIKIYIERKRVQGEREGKRAFDLRPGLATLTTNITGMMIVTAAMLIVQPAE